MKTSNCIFGRHSVAALVLSAALVVLALAGDADAKRLKRGHKVIVPIGDSYVPARVLWVNNNLVGVEAFDGTRRSVLRSQTQRFNWRVGTQVWCRWSRDNRWYRGSIAKLRKTRLTVRWASDGTTERRSLKHCAAIGSRRGTARGSMRRPAPVGTQPARHGGTVTTRTTPTRTANVRTPVSRPASTGNRDRDRMNNMFRDGVNRLRSHPSQRGSSLDPAVVGEFVRLTTAKTAQFGTLVKHNILRFERNGTGILRIQAFGLGRGDALVTDPKLGANLPFRWSVQTRKHNNVTAPLIRLRFNDGSGFAFFYGKLGTTLGAIFINEPSNTLGERTLFRGRAEFNADWNANSHKVRTALAEAKRLRQQVNTQRLMNRNLMMGNNNMLMLRTMNMGM